MFSGSSSGSRKTFTRCKMYWFENIIIVAPRSATIVPDSRCRMFAPAAKYIVAAVSVIISNDPKSD